MTSTSRLTKRAILVNSKVPLIEVLLNYGFDLSRDYERDQQFPCGLHGKDLKKSARFYPKTNSTYCWTCHKSRRPVDYVMEIENISFPDAVYFLENQFSIETLPWEEEEKEEPINWSSFDGPEFSEDDFEKYLLWMTKERSLPMGQMIKIWETFDLISFVEDDKKRLSFMKTLRGKIHESLS